MFCRTGQWEGDELVCLFGSSLQKGDYEDLEVGKITGGLQGAELRRHTHS